MRLPQGHFFPHEIGQSMSSLKTFNLYLLVKVGMDTML